MRYPETFGFTSSHSLVVYFHCSPYEEWNISRNKVGIPGEAGRGAELEMGTVQELLVVSSDLDPAN